MPPEIDLDDVVGHDPRTEVDRLLPHQLHQFGSGDAVPGVRRHVPATVLLDCRVEVLVEATGRKPWIVFNFGCERELTEGERPFQAVLFDHRPFNDQRSQIGPRRVNGGSPAGRPGTDDHNVFGAFASRRTFSFM